jgi:hypothetical protein
LYMWILMSVPDIPLFLSAGFRTSGSEEEVRHHVCLPGVVGCNLWDLHRFMTREAIKFCLLGVLLFYSALQASLWVLLYSPS